MTLEDLIQSRIDVQGEVEISPSFLTDSTSIHIPAKTESVLRASKIKKKLREINEDEEVALELCLMFLSNLSNTYMSTVDGWKRLNASILQNQLKLSRSKQEYQKIIELLSDESSFRSGAIIEVYTGYATGISRQYKLNDRFFGKGIVVYHLKTDKVKNLRRKSFFKALAEARTNPIASHLLNNVYPYLDLPTKEEIHAEAKRIISGGGKVSRGRELTYLGSRRRDKVNLEKYCLVEDSLQVFEHITGNGLMIPSKSDNAGGRVIDSLNLMPKWIRSLVKVKNKKLAECDYTCLHPNIANALYGADEIGHISHEGVAKDLGITKAEVKVEHLSFFNKRVRDMKRSPLFAYYKEKAPTMLDNVVKRKKRSHKDVTMDMFTAEVSVMTECLARFELKDIPAVYVFDALYVPRQFEETAKEIMNEVVKEGGILTKV